MRVIANRPLYGEYGTVTAGQEFDCRDEIARQLLEAGRVRLPDDPPRVRYETKVIVPSEAPEVSARLPFRHVSMPDEEQAGVAGDGNSVLPGADVSGSGAAHPGGRGRRSQSSAR
jgi:hypothetical protein